MSEYATPFYRHVVILLDVLIARARLYRRRVRFGVHYVILPSVMRCVPTCNMDFDFIAEI